MGMGMPLRCGTMRHPDLVFFLTESLCCLKRT
jgi:hypothetical protein